MDYFFRIVLQLTDLFFSCKNCKNTTLYQKNKILLHKRIINGFDISIIFLFIKIVIEKFTNIDKSFATLQAIGLFFYLLYYLELSVVILLRETFRFVS